MKLTVPILALVSALWIFGGSYYMANTNCGNSTSILAPLTIQDDDYQFKTTANQHFSFLPSSSEINIEEQAGRSFSEVARHLQQHPNRQLSLSGWYLENEVNKTTYSNLGVARAEAIKSFMVAIDASLANRIVTSGEVKTSLFNQSGNQIDGVQFSFANTAPQKIESLSSKDTDDTNDTNTVVEPKPISTGNAPRLVIYGKEDILNLDLDITMQQQIDNMKSVLDLNPGATILVTGHTAKMKSPKLGSDLGWIWSNKVRRFFRNNGIKSKEITAASKGDTEPLVPESDPKATAKNNRVVVEVILPN